MDPIAAAVGAIGSKTIEKLIGYFSPDGEDVVGKIAKDVAKIRDAVVDTGGKRQDVLVMLTEANDPLNPKMIPFRMRVKSIILTTTLTVPTLVTMRINQTTYFWYGSGTFKYDLPLFFSAGAAVSFVFGAATSAYIYFIGEPEGNPQ